MFTITYLVDGGRKHGHVPTPVGNSLDQLDPFKVFVGFKLGTTFSPLLLQDGIWFEISHLAHGGRNARHVPTKMAHSGDQ